MIYAISPRSDKDGCGAEISQRSATFYYISNSETCWMYSGWCGVVSVQPWVK